MDIIHRRISKRFYTFFFFSYRKLVSEIASIKSQCYNVLRPRKLDMYTYVGSFLVRQVLPLWPRGYMTTHALLKFVGEAEPT